MQYNVLHRSEAMGRSTTSLRLDDELRARLARRAEAEGMTLTSLAERLLSQGLAEIEHPGIHFNPGPTGWRACVSGGADVWEIVSDIRRFKGSDAERIAALSGETGIHRRQIEIALNYAASHRDEVDARVRANDAMWEEQERIEKARQSLLA
jgi:hypothetical protein